jgi:iron complex outermembrane receptor protein
LAESWLLNAGTMWEDHDLVGGRLSPRLALNWQPHPRHTLRFGVSRAYRNPVQFEKSADWRLTLNSNVGPLTQALYRPNDAIQPESNLSHEIGYLGSWPEIGLNADLRVFHESLSGLVIRSGGPAPVPYYMANVGNSKHLGADTQLRWHWAPHSFVVLNYAYLHIDTTYPQQEYFPSHVGSLLVSHRFPLETDVSVGFYTSDAFVTVDNNHPPSYRRIDFRIAKAFKLAGNKARLAYVLQHSDGADHEYDYDRLDPNRKRLSRQGYAQFQMEF